MKSNMITSFSSKFWLQARCRLHQISTWVRSSSSAMLNILDQPSVSEKYLQPSETWAAFNWGCFQRRPSRLQQGFSANDCKVPTPGMGWQNVYHVMFQPHHHNSFLSTHVWTNRQIHGKLGQHWPKRMAYAALWGALTHLPPPTPTPPLSVARRALPLQAAISMGEIWSTRIFLNLLPLYNDQCDNSILVIVVQMVTSNNKLT